MIRDPMLRGLAAISVMSACSLATNFDRDEAVEESELLCRDGTDNDADGLTDCQDWKCAGQPSCCTIPVIVLADKFDDSACSAHRSNSGGSSVPPTAGNTKFDSGSDRCHSGVSMNRISSSPRSGCSAPASRPAYSTCCTHESAITDDAGSVRAPSLNTTSAGGDEA